MVIVTPHDTHAELAALALRAGQHVWCEKPLALTHDELDEVAAAWRRLRAAARHRLQPALVPRRAGRPRGCWRRSPAPKLLVYRVAAGPVPDGHWYHDRRHGGRLLGEVCHFVDTAQALVGRRSRRRPGWPALAEPGDDAVVSLRFADGSLAVIAYGSVPARRGQGMDRGDLPGRTGSSSTTSARPRRTARSIWKGSAGQGAPGRAAAFRQAVAGRPGDADRGDAGHHAATIAAAASGPVPGDASAGAAEPGAAAPVRALFDAKAATWAAKYAPGGPLAGRRARLAAAVGALASPGARVLDLGCGSGDLARHLAEAGLRVTGCDISARMLEQAERADPAGTWVALDPAWRKLPFAAGAFGAVVASSVLEYVADPAAVLRECARVLAPGGTLLCTVPDIRHPVRWLEWPAARGADRLAALLAPRPETPGGRPGHGARLHGYLEYLRVSRQRHGGRWWAAAAGRAGLVPAALPEPGARQPLRLIAFRKPNGGPAGERPSLRPG